MKRLYESLLDDENILMQDSDSAAKKEAIEQYLQKNNIVSFNTSSSTSENILNIYDLNSKKHKFPIPEYIDINNISWCTIQAEDINNKWNLFSGSCKKINELVIFSDKNIIKNLDQLKVDKIYEIIVNIDSKAKCDKLFQNFKMPNSNTFIIDFAKNDKNIDFVDSDIQNLKGINCRYLVISDKLTQFCDQINGGAKIKKDPEVIKKIDNIFKNNKIDSLIIRINSSTDLKNYEVLKAVQGYKLKRCKLNI